MINMSAVVFCIFGVLQVANTVDGERQPQKLLKAHLGNVSTCTETEFNDTCTEGKMVRLIFSAWRAFARTSVLEKRAISRSASLNKMMEALPWWIRRVGERRLLERNFFHWQLLTLRSGQQTKPSKKRKQQSVELVPSRGIAEFDRSTKQVTRNEDSSLVDKKPPGMKGPLTTSQQKRLQKIGCPTCSESRNVTEGGRISVVPHTVEKDPDVNYSNGMAFTSRALRALQAYLLSWTLTLFPALHLYLINMFHPFQATNTWQIGIEPLKHKIRQELNLKLTSGDPLTLYQETGAHTL
jgi:hypothetical protein